MAERVLPSRERIRQGLDGERRGVRRESEILRAYSEGRLPDREDREQLVAALGIDYEDCQDPWECCIHVPPDQVV